MRSVLPSRTWSGILTPLCSYRPTVRSCDLITCTSTLSACTLPSNTKASPFPLLALGIEGSPFSCREAPTQVRSSRPCMYDSPLTTTFLPDPSLQWRIHSKARRKLPEGPRVCPSRQVSRPIARFLPARSLSVQLAARYLLWNASTFPGRTAASWIRSLILLQKDD